MNYSKKIEKNLKKFIKMFDKRKVRVYNNGIN